MCTLKFSAVNLILNLTEIKCISKWSSTECIRTHKEHKTSNHNWPRDKQIKLCYRNCGLVRFETTTTTKRFIFCSCILQWPMFCSGVKHKMTIPTILNTLTHLLLSAEFLMCSFFLVLWFVCLLLEFTVDWTSTVARNAIENKPINETARNECCLSNAMKWKRTIRECIFFYFFCYCFSFHFILFFSIFLFNNKIVWICLCTYVLVCALWKNSILTFGFLSVIGFCRFYFTASVLERDGERSFDEIAIQIRDGFVMLWRIVIAAESINENSKNKNLFRMRDAIKASAVAIQANNTEREFRLKNVFVLLLLLLVDLLSDLRSSHAVMDGWRIHVKHFILSFWMFSISIVVVVTMLSSIIEKSKEAQKQFSFSCFFFLTFSAVAVVTMNKVWNEFVKKVKCVELCSELFHGSHSHSLDNFCQCKTFFSSLFLCFFGLSSNLFGSTNVEWNGWWWRRQ